MNVHSTLYARPRPIAAGMLGQGEPLPSVNAAQRLLRGEGGAIAEVVGTMAVRASLIGVGLLVAGERDRIVTKSLVASGVIEAFVLAWEWYYR